jgi:hypothetical protein
MGGVIWVANDIHRRTTDLALRWLSIGVAAFLFVPGIILYLALRPGETLDDRAERRWEMDFLAQQAYSAPACTACGRRLREDFVRCPYCAATLGESCTACSRFNAFSWVVCPYCGESRSAEVMGGRTAVRDHTRPAVSAQPLARNGHRPVA